MTKPTLPAAQRRVPISVSLSPAALAWLDAFIASGSAATRSAAVELAIISASRPGQEHRLGDSPMSYLEPPKRKARR